MTGTPLADLWISSTAPEQPVFAYLEDVAPDGTVTVVSEGRQRASLRRVVRRPGRRSARPGDAAASRTTSR
jgi:predicted acyl esterase